MIELQHVTRTWPGSDAPAVDDLSLHVAAGELMVLLGASGSGKTTTLKMINRLVEPDRGTIRVDGEDVTAGPAPRLRRRIGYVFQGIGLFPHLTVAENVAVVPRLLGWPRPRIAARVDELLELVGLPPATYADRRPDQLSGGQRQRVGVARALAANPRVLLMDEPFGALDPVTRAELRGHFDRWRRDLGLTVVLVTHDMTEAVLLADRIAVLDHGHLVGTGTPHELLASPPDPRIEALMTLCRAEAERVHRLAEPAP